MATEAVVRRAITPGQRIEFETQTKAGRINRRTFQDFLEGRNPFVIPAEPLEQWIVFYDKFFGICADILDVTVPKNPGGFDQIIFMPAGLGYGDVERACLEMFKASWPSTEERLSDLVNIEKDVRFTKYSYAIRVRDAVEAESVGSSELEEDIFGQDTAGSVTLLERLVLGMFVQWTTGKHLDRKYVTFCAGSRYHDNNVPQIYFDPYNDQVHLGWRIIRGYRDGNHHIRRVVS